MGNKTQATTTTKTPKIVENCVLDYMQFIITDGTDKKELENLDTLVSKLSDGTVIRVRYNQDVEKYENTDTTLYEYQATQDKKEVKKLAVNIDNVKNASKKTAKMTVAKILADDSLTQAQKMQALQEFAS